MADYKYKATDSKGKLNEGLISASSEKEVETMLEDKGLKLLSLQNLKEKQSINIFANKFPTSEKISLCKYLSVMMSAGLPIEEALELLTAGTTNKVVKKVLSDISFSLRRGQSLYNSFAKYPNYFDSMFLSMIKTGEATGTLEKSFNYLASQLKQQEDLKRKVVSSLLYPAIIICLMFGVGILMMTFVLPRLGKVFLSLDLTLPLPTKILLKTSLFLEKNLIFVIVSAIVAFVSLVVFLLSPKGTSLLLSLVRKIPVLKEILLHYNLARFSQSLSALLKGGVAIGESLEIASQSLVLPQRDKIAENFTKKISRGLPLNTVFEEAQIFPPLMTRMVSIGERTGNLDKTLLEIAEFYQEEVENSLKNFITILEPVLMIVVGIGVGLMILTFISPIYSLIGKLQPG